MCKFTTCFKNLAYRRPLNLSMCVDNSADTNRRKKTVFVVVFVVFVLVFVIFVVVAFIVVVFAVVVVIIINIIIISIIISSPKDKKNKFIIQFITQTK